MGCCGDHDEERQLHARIPDGLRPLMIVFVRNSRNPSYFQWHGDVLFYRSQVQSEVSDFFAAAHHLVRSTTLGTALNQNPDTE